MWLYTWELRPAPRTPAFGCSQGCPLVAPAAPACSDRPAAPAARHSAGRPAGLSGSGDGRQPQQRRQQDTAATEQIYI